MVDSDKWGPAQAGASNGVQSKRPRIQEGGSACLCIFQPRLCHDRKWRDADCVWRVGSERWRSPISYRDYNDRDGRHSIGGSDLRNLRRGLSSATPCFAVKSLCGDQSRGHWWCVKKANRRWLTTIPPRRRRHLSRRSAWQNICAAARPTASSSSMRPYKERATTWGPRRRTPHQQGRGSAAPKLARLGFIGGQR